MCLLCTASPGVALHHKIIKTTTLMLFFIFPGSSSAHGHMGAGTLWEDRGPASALRADAQIPQQLLLPYAGHVRDTGGQETEDNHSAIIERENTLWPLLRRG